MLRPQKESFAIEILGGGGGGLQLSNHNKKPRISLSQRFQLSTVKMKLFDRFRKSLMRFINLSIPSSYSSRGSQTTWSSNSAPRRKSCDISSSADPPKTSCSSSYYSSINSHHSEAVADCIEFLNKSHQGIFSGGRKSDFMV
ncbi:hypothetical protein ACH5RR_027479 [Cinchona calisaya]|uniref:Josephin-like protein n=1 Tax=Cinchona calisaya TaxID=153742 RepID=A0ABD2Z8T3_9GENT